MNIDTASRGIGTGIGIAAMGIGLGIAFDAMKGINKKTKHITYIPPRPMKIKPLRWKW